MKRDSWVLLVLVVIVILVVTQTEEFGTIDFGDFFGGKAENGQVPVDKQLRMHMVYKYGGNPIASKSNTFQLYDSDGETILEDNLDTDGNGHCDTGSAYQSDRKLYLRYESSNDKQWWSFTVPRMNPQDAESATYNIIRLEGFTIGTYTTDALKLANGTTFADASTYNCTHYSDNPHFIYSLANTGSDNTGLLTSYDPVYDQKWDIEFYITFSGTDYEKLVIHNLNYDFTLGTTHYVGKVLDAYSLTLHKVGTDYRSLGTEDISFWIDTTGLTASASVTMQIYTYAYADHSYAQAHGGTFGSEAVQLAEHTVTIIDQ